MYRYGSTGFPGCRGDPAVDRSGHGVTTTPAPATRRPGRCRPPADPGRRRGAGAPAGREPGVTVGGRPALSPAGPPRWRRPPPGTRGRPSAGTGAGRSRRPRQELLEVPLDVAGLAVGVGHRGELLVERVAALAVDLDLLDHGERDAVRGRAEGGDLLGRPGSWAPNWLQGTRSR